MRLIPTKPFSVRSIHFERHQPDVPSKQGCVCTNASMHRCHRWIGWHAHRLISISISPRSMDHRPSPPSTDPQATICAHDDDDPIDRSWPPISAGIDADRIDDRDLPASLISTTTNDHEASQCHDHTLASSPSSHRPRIRSITDLDLSLVSRRNSSSTMNPSDEISHLALTHSHMQSPTHKSH